MTAKGLALATVLSEIAAYEGERDMELSDERLAEVYAAAEKATPGPYRSDKNGLYVWAPSAKHKGDAFPLADGGGHDALVARMRGWGYRTGNGHGALGMSSDDAVASMRDDLNFFANCDPQTIMALIDMVRQLRK